MSVVRNGSFFGPIPPPPPLSLGVFCAAIRATCGPVRNLPSGRYNGAQ